MESGFFQHHRLKVYQSVSMDPSEIHVHPLRFIHMAVRYDLWMVCTIIFRKIWVTVYSCDEGIMHVRAWVFKNVCVNPYMCVWSNYFICMSVCEFVRLFNCMYVFVSVCLWVCMFVCHDPACLTFFVNLSVLFVCTNTCMCISMCICMYTCIYVCIYVWTYVCM